MSDASLNVAFQSSGSESVGSSIAGIGTSSGGFVSTLVDNKSAITELTRGMMQLGASAMMVGVALKESNNQLISNIGNYVMLAGGLMTAVGSAAQFIKSITLITQAFQKLIATEIVKQALSGPTGWAMLGVGAAVATGAVVGVSRYESTENKANHKVTATMNGKRVGEVSF